MELEDANFSTVVIAAAPVCEVAFGIAAVADGDNDKVGIGDGSAAAAASASAPADAEIDDLVLPFPNKKSHSARIIVRSPFCSSSPDAVSVQSVILLPLLFLLLLPHPLLFLLLRVSIVFLIGTPSSVAHQQYPLVSEHCKESYFPSEGRQAGMNVSGCSFI